MYEYIDKLGGEVEKAVMTAKEIEQALGLTKTPNFRKKTEKAHFCSLRSNDMQLIKKLYNGYGSQEVEAEVAKKDWISTMVKLMLALNWQSSICDLPEGSSYSKDDKILFWNDGEVCDKFM